MPADDLDEQEDASSLRAYAEQSAAEAREAREALAQLQRKDAFRDAGLDPTNKLHSAVIAGYAGDLDGVGAYVADLGLTSTPEPEPVPPEHTDAMDRINAIGQGGDAGGSDPQDRYTQEMRDVTAQSVRENWPKERYNDEMRRISRAAGRPVAQMDYQFAGDPAPTQR